MPDENQLIAEYEEHRTDTETIADKFIQKSMDDYFCLRDDIDPRALAMHWWNALTNPDHHFSTLHFEPSPDEMTALLKFFALEYLLSHVKELQESTPSVEDVSGPFEYAPGEEQRLNAMVAAGVKKVVYKGGEIYVNP